MFTISAQLTKTLKAAEVLSKATARAAEKLDVFKPLLAKFENT